MEEKNQNKRYDSIRYNPLLERNMTDNELRICEDALKMFYAEHKKKTGKCNCSCHVHKDTPINLQGICEMCKCDLNKSG